MNVFKSLNKSHTQYSVIENSLSVKPKNLGECIALAKRAAQASQWGKKEAEYLWTNVMSSCRSLGFDLKTVLESELNDKQTILESCLNAEDWGSCLIIAHCLPEGRYCYDRVHSWSSGLILDVNGEIEQKGVLESKVPGCYCAGDLSHGRLHGKCKIKMGSDHFFEGDYVDNQKHGKGVFKSEGRTTSEGLYIDGTLVGDPYPKKKIGFFSGLLNGLSKP